MPRRVLPAVRPMARHPGTDAALEPHHRPWRQVGAPDRRAQRRSATLREADRLGALDQAEHVVHGVGAALQWVGVEWHLSRRQRLDGRGPILFRQTRIGRDGAPFEIFKFRTMVPDAEARKQELAHLNETEGLFKIAADPRITRVGAVLRRTALDELPQLLNVWRGEMSLVGPRPLVVDEDAKIEGLDRSRLHLTPGMTGHWQILGSGRIPLNEMVGIDYLYVANWSLWTDLKILLRTVPYMLARRGM